MLITLFLLSAQTLPAQEKRVTLVLKGGAELACTVTDIWQGEVYFEAASARDAYKYGEAISLEKIELVRLSRNRMMKPQEYAAYWRGETAPQEEEQTPPPKPVATQPARTQPPPTLPQPPRESGPGLRLQSLNVDTTRVQSGIGLRYPEMPRNESAPAMAYNEVADLLAETGMAGKLLYEVSAGALRRRQLTNSQKQVVDALLQSRVWASRKRELRNAHVKAADEFERLARTSNSLFEAFRFRPTDSQYSFLEFVQFLHAENVHKFLDQWQKVEGVFSSAGASALRDVLNNYDDWFYLYGQEVEKRSGNNTR
ncbi:MAG: hypothetical protein AAB354_12945 [candidate division KSB1 bacterium]